MDIQYLGSLEIPVGRMVRVEIKGRDVDSQKRGITGIVTACNKRHFTVQAQKYSESFLKVDLILGLIRVTEYKIELIERKRSDVSELISRTNIGADGSLKKNNLELILGTAK